MGTLKMLKGSGCIATTAEDAINILYTGEYHRVVLYSSQEAVLRKLCNQVYTEIRSRNAKIPDVDDQMLPVEPYFWDDIDGCLAVKCAEISMGRFADCAGALYLFSQPKYDCLSDPNARKPLSKKAMSSLWLIGTMMTDAN